MAVNLLCVVALCNFNDHSSCKCHFHSLTVLSIHGTFRSIHIYGVQLPMFIDPVLFRRFHHLLPFSFHPQTDNATIHTPQQVLVNFEMKPHVDHHQIRICESNTRSSILTARPSEKHPLGVSIRIYCETWHVVPLRIATSHPSLIVVYV